MKGKFWTKLGAAVSCILALAVLTPQAWAGDYLTPAVHCIGYGEDGTPSDAHGVPVYLESGDESGQFIFLSKSVMDYWDPENICTLSVDGEEVGYGELKGMLDGLVVMKVIESDYRLGMTPEVAVVGEPLELVGMNTDGSGLTSLNIKITGVSSHQDQEFFVRMEYLLNRTSNVDIYAPAAILDENACLVGMLMVEDGELSCYGFTEPEGVSTPAQQLEPEPKPEPKPKPEPTPDPEPLYPHSSSKDKSEAYWTQVGEEILAPLVLMIVCAVILIVLILRKKKKAAAVSAAVPEAPLPVEPPAVPDEVSESVPTAPAAPAPVPEAVPAPVPAPAVPGSDFVLRVVDGPLMGLNFHVKEEPVWMGRNPECLIRYPAETQGVSRIHCQVFRHHNELMIVDMGSSAGTYLSRLGRITPKVAIPLVDDDVIYLGSKQNKLVFVKK